LCWALSVVTRLAGHWTNWQATETLHGRRIVIQRLKRDQDLRQCQLLFISRSEKDHVGSILAKLAGGTVLTVSEIEGFSTTGGVIGLVFDDDRVRFEINLDNAASAGLTISAKLSSLARTVRRSVSSESVRRPGVTLAMDRLPSRPPFSGFPAANVAFGSHQLQ
jgi:hypothetical protein